MINTEKALKANTVKRVITLAALCIAVAGVAFVVIANPTENELFICAYNRVLHLHCPTCGATRAVYYFFTFKFREAFYYHAYFVSLSPVGAYLSVAAAVNGVAGRKIIPLPRFHWVYPVAFLAGLFVFGILRNFTPVIY